MNTKILPQTPKGVAEAGDILRQGGLVAIPTETVYGLAADALNETAVRRIYAAKGRPPDNPLIVHIAAQTELSALVREIPEEALRLAAHFWPGPLTMILPKSDAVSETVSGGLDTVAVRLPSDETARAIIRAAGTPLAAPSANTSGTPSPTAFEHVRRDLSGKVDAIIQGGDCAVGVESTVVSLVGRPRLLRPGGVTHVQLEAVIGPVEIDPAVLNLMSGEARAASPGMKYRHYAPKADVVVVDASPEEYVRYVEDRGDGFALCFDEDLEKLSVPAVSYGTRYDGAKQANRIFEALHRLDSQGAKRVYARIPSKRDMGLAVYNRLIRSAGFRVVNPYGHYIIGLTGPSGAGKTTVGRAFQALGCLHVDCDAITKAPDVYDADCLKELQEAFGHDMIENGVLNRRKLARKAYATPEGTARLNAITHPRIMRHVRGAIEAGLQAGHKLVVVDAPTLFESGLDTACARIVVVTASEETRRSRITRRDGLTEAEAAARLAAQRPQAFYTRRADHIVDGEAGSFDRRLQPIVSGLLEKCGGSAGPQKNEQRFS